MICDMANLPQSPAFYYDYIFYVAICYNLVLLQLTIGSSMAKSASPIRLQEDLMQVAESTAKRFHRSTAEQIEYWADIGRQASEVIDPDILLSLASGLTRIKVEPVDDRMVNPAEVFQALETERSNGSLIHKVTSSKVKYQVCETQPGYLERLDSTGAITIGQFKDGVFSPLLETDD